MGRCLSPNVGCGVGGVVTPHKSPDEGGGGLEDLFTPRRGIALISPSPLINDNNYEIKYFWI
jgi:hypothetical protein